MKTIFRNIHLFLGLAAGLVITTCCFSGAVLVFEKELQEVTHHDRYFVQPQQLHLPMEQLVSSVATAYPKAKVLSVKLYNDPGRSVEIGVSMTGEKDRNLAKKSERDEQKGKTDKQGKGSKKGGTAGGRPSHTAFVNPYTGQVIELYNYRDSFFFTMLSLHRWLLGGEDTIGKVITGISTVIFLFIIITGIVLWWPRNKAILKQRLKIKTDANWKRLNHDYHVVLGFYTSIFLFIFAFTALAWSFRWFNDGIYAVTGTSPDSPALPTSTYAGGAKRIGYDAAFVAVNSLAPEVQYTMLRSPGDSTGVFTATVLPKGAHETGGDSYYIDQYNGKIVGRLKFSDKNLGQRVRATFKPVHVGSIFGTPSKVIAFVVCVLGGTFPITGVIMWINRLKKKNRKQVTVEIETLQEA